MEKATTKKARTLDTPTHSTRTPVSKPSPNPAAKTIPPFHTDSTDLDLEASDPQEMGLYVQTPPTALHLGFQSPGWRTQTVDGAPRFEYCRRARAVVVFWGGVTGYGFWGGVSGCGFVFELPSERARFRRVTNAAPALREATQARWGPQHPVQQS